MHAVVTGASSGIGRAMALELGRAGYDVTLVARRESELQEIAKALPKRSQVFKVDLSDSNQITGWVEKAEAELGPIDLFFNNAGVAEVDLFLKSDLEKSERMMTVNLTAPLRLLHDIGRRMGKRGTGTIVNVASISAFASPSGMSWYSASKAGFAAASEQMALELKKNGVHVITVYPGPVTTPMAEVNGRRYGAIASKTPTGNPTQLAFRILNAIEAKSPRLIYPRFYWVTWFFPRLTRWVSSFSDPTERT